jgi:hypothetical protein
MATNIVPSLFGLTQQQVRQQQLAEDQQFAQQFASMQRTPSSKQRALLGATVGSGLVRGIAGLFGLQTGAERQASAMDEALQVATQSLPPEQRGNRAAVMSKVADVLSSNPNFQREALQATMQAAQFAKEDNEAAADLAYKKGLTEYYGVLQTDKLAEQESKKLERQGQVAFGALNSIERAKDPAAQTKIWENALAALEKQGLDINTIKDIPWEQRKTILEGIVDSSETSATRVKAEVAGLKQQFAEVQFQERARHNLAMEGLSREKMALTEQLTNQRLATAERLALENKMNGINAQMDRLDKTQAWRTQGQFTSQIGTKEFDKNIKGYFREELGFGDKEVSKVLPEFNAAYGKYLGTKDENGYPRYSSQEALNLAKKEIESGTSKVTKTFAGFEVPGTTKPVFKGGGSARPSSNVIKLD